MGGAFEMRRIGWVLLLAGYLAIIGQIADHDPPAKTFAIRFIGAVPKDQMMRSDEVRR